MTDGAVDRKGNRGRKKLSEDVDTCLMASYRDVCQTQPSFTWTDREDNIIVLLYNGRIRLSN